jgi:N-dimethylarginine dimethylaminohydrolase
VLKEKFPMFDYKSLQIGGHLDSVFSVLKPRYIIAGPWFRGNENVFKDWNIVYFEDSKWDKVSAFFELRDKNRGDWWVPGEEHNDQFTEFVEAFLPNWTGYCEETIFDLNCLVVDDKHVVVNAENPELLKVLRDLKLEPIVCPLRNRFFWDGGWHCLTLDIRRRGGQVDYRI